MIKAQETNIIYLSSLLFTDERFKSFFEKLSGILNSYQISYNLLPKTKDIWARDYMPIQVGLEDFLEYRYDPDYLQGTSKEERNLKTYPDMVCDALGIKTRKTDLILDGGNLVNSQNCIILTDKVVQENKLAYSKKELIKKLHEEFNVEKVVLVPWDKSDLYGHIDGVLRFIDTETVLVNDCYRKDRTLLSLLKRNGIKTETFHYTVNSPDKGNWVYLNFLQTEDIMIVPTIGAEEDTQALQQLGHFFPNYQKKNRIIPLRSEDVLQFGGALNCISWTMKELKSAVISTITHG